ncbi:hypothetical protein [Streptomyces rubellomurinus]|uniref:hypothetical protein n=1 Tax=Streptomyces rubellomurinus (strain ATCC 31215) TaxID=359131 RepID=UPI000695D450|nr:hypothetical protein [Streptomyces rubellomurinus]
MGIGYLLLYVALAVVALWLVAEVLLQNRAPLHWRLLALAGFLGVAAGMTLGSVVVIGAGAVLFAVGQTFVTLSVKRGYQAGWSLRKADGALPGPLAKVPLLGALTGGAAVAAAAAAAEERVGEVGSVEEAAPDEVAQDVPEVERTAAFEPQGLAEDGVYAPGYYEQQPEAQPQAGQHQDFQPQAGQHQDFQHQQQDPYAGAYQAGYDQQQWQTQQQPAYASYDQAYGGYPQQHQDLQHQQQDPYAGAYQAGYDQQQWQAQPQGWDQNAQQQWQPQQAVPQQAVPQQAVPQQPGYDQHQHYGYQQQNTWQQG